MIKRCNLTKDAGAVFSDCEKYRYLLWRYWGNGASCLFIMLNPSTATEEVLDPTIRRCVGFAQGWGFGGITICNLFGYRATDPTVMKRQDDPIGPDNDDVIRDQNEIAALTVVAWGTHGTFRGRDKEVLKYLKKPHCLELTKWRYPAHPLYLRGSCEPFVFAG